MPDAPRKAQTPTSREDQRGCPPVADYAVIGDCHGAALVCRDGSIDWCCLGRFDTDPVFCRVLDRDRGGFLHVRPVGHHRPSHRFYVAETNILVTEFPIPEGLLRITDLMPVGRREGARLHDYVDLVAPRWLVRRIEAVGASAEVAVDYRPSARFARERPALWRSDGAVRAGDGATLYADLPFELNGDLARARLRLEPGEHRDLVLTSRPCARTDPTSIVDKLLDVTAAFWHEWLAYCRYRGPYRAAVERSALTLKLLTYAPSGALVAAPTTSLPEEIGGLRNWDYRYCWLRDASFTLYALYALAALGYGGEARRFAGFLLGCCDASRPRLQIMYGIEGESELEEEELPHLDGYAGSHPVRTGNGAYRQHQIDVYGEVMDWAHLYHALGGEVGPEERDLLQVVTTAVAQEWQEPDQGLWEMRGPPRHHVFGKLMSWVALDRWLTMFGDPGGWAALKDDIRREIWRRGSANGGGLTGIYDSSEMDAALLLAPMLGFPMREESLQATIAAVRRDLGQGRFLYRYLQEDGIAGGEGAFLVCSFWLVDALLCLDKADEAREFFEQLLECGNDLGLLSEQADEHSGALLGNFPQALSHLALVNSAVLLQLHERYGAHAVSGTHADRARLSVQAVFGWRAVWAALRQSGRLGRFRSSMLADDLLRRAAP